MKDEHTISLLVLPWKQCEFIINFINYWMFFFLDHVSKMKSLFFKDRNRGWKYYTLKYYYEKVKEDNRNIVADEPNRSHGNCIKADQTVIHGLK